MRTARPGGQRGATLVIALIMLVALAMLSAWAFNGSQMNMRAVVTGPGAYAQLSQPAERCW